MWAGPPSPLPASPESTTSVFIYFDSSSSNIRVIDLLMLPTKQTNWAGVYYLISRILMLEIYWCWTGHTHAMQQACNVEKRAVFTFSYTEPLWMTVLVYMYPLLQLSPSFRPRTSVLNNWRGEHQDLVRYCIYSIILNNQVMNIKVEMQ